MDFVSFPIVNAGFKLLEIDGSVSTMLENGGNIIMEIVVILTNIYNVEIIQRFLPVDLICSF